MSAASGTGDTVGLEPHRSTVQTGKPPRIFRGWWVVLGTFVVMTAGSGFAFYAQGVFLDALVDEQGFSVGMVGAGTGLFFVVSGIVGYYVGGLIARFDIRVVMILGSLVAAVGIALLGQVRTEWQMVAVFLIFGGGYAGAGLVPATSVVTRWFEAKRSIALSVASTGLSVGGIAITPFIAQVIDDRSLAEVAPTLAVAYLLWVIPVTLLLIRPWPHDYGLAPDGVVPAGSGGGGDEQAGGPAAPPAGWRFADAIRTRYFRLMSLAFILVMGAQVGALQHMFKLTKDAVDIDAASLALVLVTSTSVAGRLVGGVVASKWPLRAMTSGLIVVQALGIAIIGLADSRTMIFVGVVVLGSSIGNLLMLHPLLLAESFGVAEYSRIYGLGSLLMVCGVGAGPFIVGLLRDAADYRVAFLTMTGLALVGLMVYRLAGTVASEESAGVGNPGAPAGVDNT